MAPTGVEETGQGTGEYTVKAAGLKTPVDHLFHSGTAAAVAYDVSRILAMKTGFVKPEPKKGFNLKPASEEFLEHLVDTQTVKDRDQVLLVVKHVGRMLDVFLERHEQAPLFPAQEEDYDQKVKFCFRDSGNFRQMSIDQVPGLQNIKEYHDSGKLFIPGRRGRPPLKRVQEGQPDTDTKTNASASLRASTTPARGKSARGRKKQGEVVTADEEAFSGHLPGRLPRPQSQGEIAEPVAEAFSGHLPPQTQADVAAAVAEAASGDLTQGEVAARVAEAFSGQLPPQTQADVAAAVAEPASGVLSLPQTEGDVQSVAEYGLGRGRGRGRGRPRGSGRGKSQGRGSGKDTGNLPPPPQTQGEVVTADEEAFSGHLPPQTQADVAAAVAEPASGDLTQGEVAAPVAEAFSGPQTQADVAAVVAKPASGDLSHVHSVAEHRLGRGRGRGRGRPRGSGRAKSQGRGRGKDTGNLPPQTQGEVVAADEEAFSGHIPPPQTQGKIAAPVAENAEAFSGHLPQTQADVAAAVAEAASGDLTQGEVAAPVAEAFSGHLPPQTQADVAAVVAEPASGDLSHVHSVAEHGLGRGRGRGRGRPRGSGRAKSQGRGSGKDTGNLPPQTQGEVVAADEEAFSGHLPQTQADVAAAVAEAASGDLTQGEVAAPVAEAFSGQLPPQTQADVAAAMAEPASGVISLPQTEGDVQSVAEHGLGRGRGRGRPRGSGRGKSQGRDSGRGSGKDTGRSESEGQGRSGGQPGRRGRPPGRGRTPGRERTPGRGRGRRPTNPDMNVAEAGGLDALSIPESPAAQPPPSPPSGAEENEKSTETGDVEKGEGVPELRNVRKRKRDDKGKAIATTTTSTGAARRTRSNTRDAKGKAIATNGTSNTRDVKGKGIASTGDEIGYGKASTSERRIVSGGPYLILEVETQCDTHGVSTSTHYHFAHDCVCDAVNDVVLCYFYFNQHPLKRSQLSEFELPPCFQQWKNTHRQFFETSS